MLSAVPKTYFNFHVGNVLAEHLDLKPAVVSQIPLFDSRVFNLPKEEVVNMFVWRQQDASRNSVNMFARHFFSHKELHGKSTSQVMDMLMLEKGNFADLAEARHKMLITKALLKREIKTRDPEILETYTFFDTEKDKKVTVRDRDTAKQERVLVEKLPEYFKKKLSS